MVVELLYANSNVQLGIARLIAAAMSWKTSGKLLSGPPTSSNANKLDSRFKPNLGGRNAFQREQHLARHYGDSNDPVPQGRTEWDVLKENHR